MGSAFDLAHFDKIGSQAREYFFQHVLSWSMAAQIVAIGGALLLAHRATGAMRAWLTGQQAQYATHPEACADLAVLLDFVKVIDAFIAFILVAVAYSIAGHFNWPRNELFAVGNILMALTLVRLFTDEMKNRFWAKILAVAIWVYAFLLASLGFFNLTDVWFRLLQDIDFQLGHLRFSLFHVQRAFVLLLALYWVSKNLRVLSHFWLTVKSGLTPALQILFYRLGSIFLYSACIVIVFHYLGIDLTVFALFSGALGLGLGFGLQKVFANLVSGFLLLADKSIKPGDVIQVGETYGWVNNLKTRYISVITRDAVEYLIPNEDLITSKVVNWSYSHNLIRVKIPVGIAYGADLELAMKLMLEAAAAVPRVLAKPEPSCRLIQFGDSSINFEVRVWINDPQSGVGGLRSDVLLEIWRRFQEHGIEIPFPQRDVHFKSMPEAMFRTGPEEG